MKAAWSTAGTDVVVREVRSSEIAVVADLADASQREGGDDSARMIIVNG